MLWVKAFHIVFVASWFAGLFYLPRIFVNLAMVPAGSDAERERLLLMATKLLRFTTILAVPALGLGFWLWLGYGIGRGPGNGWLHAKLFIVLLVVGYHHACGAILKKLVRGDSHRSHVWYRWFNEVPVLMMIYVVGLVVVKPTDLLNFFLSLSLFLAEIGIFALFVVWLIRKWHTRKT